MFDTIKDAILEDINEFEDPDSKITKPAIDPVYLSRESEMAQDGMSTEFQEDYELNREDLEPHYFLAVGEMDIFERMVTYTDRYPLLYIRKKIWYVQQLISYICATVISHDIFEAVALTVIIANSVVLALDNPTETTTTETQDIIDWVFLYLYTIEMGLKIIGLGFIFSKTAYLKDSWNILDFIIVFTA